jgi:xanthine/CO dehydrogenase XdhC/CoxF family maturation factor
MVKLANVLGWETTVIDGRSNYANRRRFPSANHVVVSKPATALADIEIDTTTAAVLMTHNYNYDIAVLEQLVETNVMYIGVLGPKKKMNKMLEELAGKRVNVQDKINSIHGPAGLDIGSETSEEIALSILAEIKAVFAGKEGTFLRNKKESIHTTEHQPKPQYGHVPAVFNAAHQ